MGLAREDVPQPLLPSLHPLTAVAWNMTVSRVSTGGSLLGTGAAVIAGVSDRSLILSERYVGAWVEFNVEVLEPKGNLLQGTLTKCEVLFYLCSHIALQGTSQPIYYTALYDDANHKPDVIQNMIYEQNYQNMRSTTSVSLHPAVYYAHLASLHPAVYHAHLASKRAKVPKDIQNSVRPQRGPGYNMQSPSHT